MPFLDRLEMVAVSGWSRGAVYEAVRRLEDDGLIASVPHATDLTPPTRRFHLTAAGLRRLAEEEHIDVDDLLRGHPVSARWRRVLLERLDALAVVYRLASAVSNLAYPVRFQWYRAMPVDAAMTLPGGRTVAIVRQGLTSDRTGFSKRLWRLTQGQRPGAVLMLMPDEVRLRHARRLLARTSVPALLAPEREAAAAAPDDPIWRLPSVNAAVSLRAVIDRLPPGGTLPAERPLARVSLPPDIDERGPGGDAPDYLLPALLKPAEKRVLDLLSDWPWLSLQDLAGLLGVSDQRASKLTTALEGFGLAARAPAAGRRLTLTDLGLATLARRDRTAVGGARKRWSAAPTDAGDWRNVSGRRSRQLLRDMEHTAAVHGFVAALARQARDLGWEIDQLDPPIRASRYFRHFGGMRSVQPDAFGALRQGSVVWPFFLEWERRAVRPRHYEGAAGPLPALLLLPPAHRRPRREARGPGRLRRRHRPDPLPQSGPGEDGPDKDRAPSAGLPPGPAGSRGAAGTGLARTGRRLGAGLPPAAILHTAIKHGRPNAMRLYYIDESEGPRYYVRTALGVDAEWWNDLSQDIHAWRLELQDRCAVPTDRELHACDLLAGRGKLAREGNADRRLTPEQGAEVFTEGLRRIEDAARSTGGVEVINVCLRKSDVRGYERVSLDRLLNRINTSVASAGRHAFLIFDEGKEEMVARLYHRLRGRNPVPSRYDVWEDGEPTRNIPIEKVIGGPAFRSSHSDYLLQMADLIAHALLKQEEEPVPRVQRLGIGQAFGILDRALNRRASRRDPQGVVRK